MHSNPIPDFAFSDNFAIHAAAEATAHLAAAADCAACALRLQLTAWPIHLNAEERHICLALD